MDLLPKLLEKSAEFHHHLCPRQVLGVRMGMLAGDVLGIAVPQSHNSKRLYTIMETDGCAANGVSVATNCWLGRRTLRVEDYGKVAATFIDKKTKQAVRISPRGTIRQNARSFATEAGNRWEAMLLGYQRMPIHELLSVHEVILKTPIEIIVSHPDKKAICDFCGEEIMNERQIVHDGIIQCQACAGYGYYSLITAVSPSEYPPVSSNLSAE